MMNTTTAGQIDTQACQATSAAELERRIMDPNIPKNEQEWWAAGEIHRLRDLLNGGCPMHPAPPATNAQSDAVKESIALVERHKCCEVYVLCQLGPRIPPAYKRAHSTKLGDVCADADNLRPLVAALADANQHNEVLQRHYASLETQNFDLTHELEAVVKKLGIERGYSADLNRRLLVARAALDRLSVPDDECPHDPRHGYSHTAELICRSYAAIGALASIDAPPSPDSNAKTTTKESTSANVQEPMTGLPYERVVGRGEQADAAPGKMARCEQQPGVLHRCIRYPACCALLMPGERCYLCNALPRGEWKVAP